MAWHLRGQHLNAGLCDSSLLVPLPEVDLEVGASAQRRQNLIILRAELNTEERSGLRVRHHDDLALLENGRVDLRLVSFLLLDRFDDLGYLVDAADGLGRGFADGEEASRLVHVEASDAFCSLYSRNKALTLVRDGIKHDIVAARIHHYLIVNVEDGVRHVRLHTAHEARVTRDGGQAGCGLALKLLRLL